MWIIGTDATFHPYQKNIEILIIRGKNERILF